MTPPAAAAAGAAAASSSSSSSLSSSSTSLSSFSDEHTAIQNFSSNKTLRRTPPARAMASDRDPSAVLHRSLNEVPPRCIRARDHYLYFEDRPPVFDASGGAAVSCIGHGNRQVCEAVFDEMLYGVDYQCTVSCSNRSQEDLAKWLRNVSNGEMALTYFCNSGSDAVEAAMKLALQYFQEKEPPEPGRTHFISREQSYHGNTIGALSISGHRARRAPYEANLKVSHSRVSACNAYRGMKGGESESDYVARLELELDEEFNKIGPKKVAAFVAEPVVGAALGCVPSVEGYFQAVRRVCDKHGALLIFDEVMCGFGRVGPRRTEKYPCALHAWQDPSIDVVPDIMTVAKGIGGGYMAMGAMLAGRRVADVLRKGSGEFRHGQTYQGHSPSCRAALEICKIVDEQNLIVRNRQMGDLLGRLLKQQLSKHPHVGDIRGQGLFWGIEFVQNKTTKKAFPRGWDVGMKVQERGMHAPFSIHVYPGQGCAENGHAGDHIILAPAYNISEEEVRLVVQRTSDLIHDFFRGFGEQQASRKRD